MEGLTRLRGHATALVGEDALVIVVAYFSPLLTRDDALDGGARRSRPRLRWGGVRRQQTRRGEAPVCGAFSAESVDLPVPLTHARGWGRNRMLLFHAKIVTQAPSLHGAEPFPLLVRAPTTTRYEIIFSFCHFLLVLIISESTIAWF